jgi:catechol 2,3-dioxygenase-like lactoylglutathione lyase family enzyme
MISRVSHVSLLVSDQNEALAFYKDKLGFKIHTDAMFDEMRWLTLCTPDAPDFELVLMLAGPEDKALVGKQGGSYPFICFETRDCLGAYEALKAKGIQFNEEPKTEPWGIGVGFKDLYGNMIYMSQPIAQ